MCFRTSASCRPGSVVMSALLDEHAPAIRLRTSPMMWRRATLLPVPLRPSRQNAWPLGISNEISSSTFRVPKALDT